MCDSLCDDGQFKENCPDLRNTGAVDIIQVLKGCGIYIDICNPWVDATEAEREYGLQMKDTPDAKSYDSVIVAVARFRKMILLSAMESLKPWSLIKKGYCREV